MNLSKVQDYNFIMQPFSIDVQERIIVQENCELILGSVHSDDLLLFIQFQACVTMYVGTDDL